MEALAPRLKDRIKQLGVLKEPELTLSDEAKCFQMLVSEISKDQIDEFDYWVTHKLAAQISSRVVKTTLGQWTFSNIIL